MKGLQGIVVAVALAIGAAFCNWYYISRQASGYQTESFVIISPNAQLNRGDRIRSEHLARVDVPIQHIGDLKSVAILWSDRSTIEGIAAVEAYKGGELFLQKDRVAPARKDLSENLAPNEVAFPVPVDSRTFVPDNYNPGDNVSFFVSELLQAGDPNAPASPNAAPAAAAGLRGDRMVGPFRILALGARRSSLDVERANAGAGRASREDVITVGLVRKDNEFEPDAKALFNLLRMTSNRGVQVVKHHKPEKK